MLETLARRHRQRRQQSGGARATMRGMTLLEIMIVLAIIALVMGLLVGPKVLSSLTSAEKSTFWLTAKQLAEEAYPRWRGDNIGKSCPAGLNDLLKYSNLTDEDLKSEDGNDKYKMLCGSDAPEGIPNAFGVVYVGTDGKFGTDDDIKSWEKKPKD